MKVAIINMYLGGMLHYSTGLANTLVRCNDPCEVASFGPAAANPDLFDDRVQRFTYALPQSITRAFLSQSQKLLQAASAIPHDLRAWNPDIIHVNSGHITYPLFIRHLARDYPMVSSIHDVQPHLGEKRPFERFKLMPIVKHSRAICVHGELLRTEALARWALHPDHVHVLPLVVEQQPNIEPAEVKRGAELLMFGRIFAYKGFDVLFDAMPRLIEAMPDVRVTIAGAGDLSPWRTHLQRFQANLRVINRFVSEREIAALFSETNVVLLPYIEASQSGVAYTAALYGKPVVASRIGAVPEFVEEGKTGLLVTPGDPSVLAEAIEKLLKDHELSERMGGQARRHVESLTDPNRVGLLLKDIYRTYLAKHEVSA